MLRAPRAGTVSRTLAGMLGGYALAHSLPAMLFTLLPLTRADAVMAAGQLAFLIFAAAILWAFAARSLGLAWLGLLLPAAGSLLIWGLFR